MSTSGLWKIRRNSSRDGSGQLRNATGIFSSRRFWLAGKILTGLRIFLAYSRPCRGNAFRKSAPGREFYDFFGEQVFRSDLSISVGELGSLLDHSGSIGDAEKYAAKVFGADRTYFVTNGTSTANKIVFMGCVTAGDIVLVDRNCHKSIEHAVTMTHSLPVYLIPTRNRYGIIGPIHPDEMLPETIAAKIEASPLTRNR
jgi:arginine decarboxylase